MSFPSSLLVAPRRARAASKPRQAAVRLRQDEVDLWRAELDEQPAGVGQFMQTLLSSDEAERARRFHFERDRRRFVVGRGILRILLGKYLGRGPRDIVFCYGARGKPGVMDRGSPPVHFNVAHAEGLAYYAFTRQGEIGVDVERIREVPEWETIATSLFTPGELGRLCACAAERRREEFFCAWTRQEAVVKAHGVGLGGATGGSRPAATRADNENAPAGRIGDCPAFAVHSLEAGAGFVGALAVAPAVRWATHRSWNPQDAANEGAGFAARARRVPLKLFSEAGPVPS